MTEVADAQPGADQDYTLSMFDINQTTAIGTAITQFANAAAIDVYANPTPYIQATTQVRRYGISGDFWYGFVDLGEYLNVLDGVSPEVATARDNLLTAISNALVGQRNGTPVFDAATGMTIYFPNEPRDFDSDFQALATAGPWMPFLEAFYNAQAGVVLQTDVGFAAETLTVAPVVDDPGFYADHRPRDRQLRRLRATRRRDDRRQRRADVLRDRRRPGQRQRRHRRSSCRR